MKKKTWLRLKDNAPLIFVAAMVSLLAQFVYAHKGSTSGWKELLTATADAVICTGIALGVIYFLCWLLYKLDKK